MTRRVSAGSLLLLLLSFLARGGRAERAWSSALQAELATAASGGHPWWLGGEGQVQPTEEGPLGPVLQNLKRQGLQRQSSPASGEARPTETEPEKAESVRVESESGGPPGKLVRESSQLGALGSVRPVERKAQPTEPEEGESTTAASPGGGPPGSLAPPGKLVRESSQLGALGSVRPSYRKYRQAAAPGSDTKEEQRFLEHLHASGTPPDALARAARQLDGLDERVSEAAPLPEAFKVACNTENATDPKQMLATLHGCTEALDRLAEQTKSVEGADRAANEKDVEALKNTEEELMALKNPKSFHEAWDEDQQAALKHLLGQVSKSEVSIANLAASP